MEISCLQDIDAVRAALKRREELLSNKEVPRQSELYQNLGDSLGQIVIGNMNQLSKELMGVTNPLKGPPNDMWVPPSNRIKNKVLLVPPSPIDITKAFLHQGILEIGAEMDAKVEETCLERIKKATSDVSEFERFECERRLKFALECLRRRHQQEIKNITEQHQADLFTLREALHKEYICSRTEYVSKFRCYCNEIPTKTQEIAVQTDPIKEQRNDGYNLAEMARKQAQVNRTLRCLWEDFKEHLKMQRHILACTRMTELMHVICAQKLDAQQKIKKIRQTYTNELNRVVGQTGYKTIKDGYLSVLKNFKKFIELTADTIPEHQEFLSEFQKSIQKSIIEVEFYENLCRCCQNVKKTIEEDNSGTSKLRGPDGVIIFPESYGEKVFCTCHSTSEDEDDEIQRRLTANITSKLATDKADAQWSSLSEGDIKTTSSSETKSASSAELPIDSDLLLAKKIARLIDIEHILINAFAELVDHGVISSDTLHHKIFDYVAREFKVKFNPNAILNVISSINTQRKKSMIMGARDSLELVKAKRNTNSRIFPLNELKAPTPSSTTSSAPSSSTTEYTSSSTTTIIGAEEALSATESINEQEPDEMNVEVHKDVIRLSEQRRSSCWKSTEKEADIKETNLKEGMTSQQFWQSMVKTPKYLVPPCSHSDPDWIYHKCTEEEWNNLMDQYRSEIVKEEEENSPQFASSESMADQADPELMKEVVDAYKECTKEAPHPFGKLRVRSLIELLEQNEDVNKLLYKNRCHSKVNNL